jgi:hypothetical protein
LRPIECANQELGIQFAHSNEWSQAECRKKERSYFVDQASMLLKFKYNEVIAIALKGIGYDAMKRTEANQPHHQSNPGLRFLSFSDKVNRLPASKKGAL